MLHFLLGRPAPGTLLSVFDPALMIAAQFEGLVRGGLARLADRFEHDGSLMAVAAQRWQHALADGGDPSVYFTQRYRFPVLQFPSWVAESIGVELPADFANDLAYSTISGYYFIRLLDDVVDGDEPTEPALLPLSAVFHTEFMMPYFAWFPATSAFWEHFRRAWYESAGATMREAAFPSMDEATFQGISARKIAAAEIPAIAVALQYGRGDVVEPWCRLVRLMGRHEQMLDDVFDWHRDSTKGRHSYFLSEAARLGRPSESTEEWVLRDGFQQGLAAVAGGQAELLGAARAVGSPGAEAFVLDRIDLVRTTGEELGPTLERLAAIAPYFAASHQPDHERTLP